MGLRDLFFRGRALEYDSFGPHCRGLSVRKGRAVFFIDEARGIRRLILDRNGYFHGFPGVLREECWTKHFSGRLVPRAQFYTSVQLRPDGRWRILWTIQPDGLYWADDGFGAGNDEEIILCAHLDADGRFTGPFSVCSVGDKEYFQEGSR